MSGSHRRREALQLELTLPTWGGRREGAGRKRVAARRQVSHRVRNVRAGRFPVIVTMRLRREWRGLREPELLAPLRALVAAVNAGGVLRLVEYCFLDDHVHLLVEAADARS